MGVLCPILVSCATCIVVVTVLVVCVEASPTHSAGSAREKIAGAVRRYDVVKVPIGFIAHVLYKFCTVRVISCRCVTVAY